MINSTNSSIYENQVEFKVNTNLILTLNILWAFIILIGISANSFVLSVLLCGTRLTTTTQYFIVNLSTSDLIFLLTCPLITMLHYNNIDVNLLNGKFFCKFSHTLTYMTAFTTCLTLMSMTIDRYLAFNYPLQSLVYRSKKKAICINVAIWSLSCLLSLPHAYYRIYVPAPPHANESGYCTQSNLLENTFLVGTFNLDQFVSVYTVIVAYVLPLIAILWSYMVMVCRLNDEKRVLYDALVRIKQMRQQNRKHVLIMIGLVTLLFALCWLPIHCIHLAFKFVQNDFPIWNKHLYLFKAFAHTLTFLNSALNPILYTICGQDFRRRFKMKKQISLKKSNNNYDNINNNKTLGNSCKYQNSIQLRSFRTTLASMNNGTGSLRL